MHDGVGFPPRMMRAFAEILASELGIDTLSAVLAKAGLPTHWAKPALFTDFDDRQAAKAYSKLQAALRTYYGRGARGILLRIGGKLWERLLDNASFGLKAQATLVRGLPAGVKLKPSLEILRRLVSAEDGDFTVHTLDFDLLCVDHASPTTLGQSDSAPICFVTLGMIRECLYWSLGHEHDIEEIACRALGAKDCEFKITTGG